MKTVIVLSLLLCAASAFRLNEMRPFGRIDVSPRSECVGIPNGTQIPHPVNCNQFILCENNLGLTLTCRSTSPHFDRCNGRCVNDISVCMITNCNGAPTTTPSVTTTPEESTTPEIPTVSTEPEETTTTTRFVVPTVP